MERHSVFMDRKMSIPHKVVYQFNTLLIKIPIAFFTEMEILIFKYIKNCKGL